MRTYPQQMTGSGVSIIANPPTIEEATLQELQVIPISSSSGAATTSVEPTGLHLDSSFISQTPLKAISSMGTILSTGVYPVVTGELRIITPAEGRSPKYQEKGASVDDFRETFPKSTTDTTTSGGKSDDPINLGDGLKYRELTERVDKLDNFVAEIKNMLQQLLQAQKVTPTVATSASSATAATSPAKLWNLFQPMLHQQTQYADQQHELQIQKIKNLMEARFKNTQADIKAIKAHLLQTTGTAPPTIIFIDNPPDDAKKGEKVKKKKGYEDGLYIEPDAKSKLVVEIPKPDGSKKVDESQNALDAAKAGIKETMEIKGIKRFEQEKKVLMDKEEQGTSEPKEEEGKPKRRQPTRKVRQPKSTPSRITKHTPQTPKSSSHQTSKPTDVETPVVSTVVGPSVVSTNVISTTALTIIPSTTQSTGTPQNSTPLQTPPATVQKTIVDTSTVVMTTVVETPLVSTTVSA
ncbi:hypothetical protein HanRHA438_Chr13g0609011 [Helianthus annuus]|nr:hypothetical protein HanRHA438_Chr13g0609011 [Helianthus annuus]